MFKAIINWWNRDKIAREAEQARVNDALASMQQEIAALKQTKEIVEQELKETTAELEEANSELQMHRDKDAADEERRNGSEPWVEIKSAEFNEVKGIQIALDWNDAFVAYLRENGITARDDDSVVQKWLLMLYKDLIERLDNQVIENSDKHFINDFE